jgi:hypothetical protein
MDKDGVSLAEEKHLLQRVAWPSHEPLAFLRRRGGLRRGLLGGGAPTSHRP